MKVIEDLKAVIVPPATPNVVLVSLSDWQELFDRLGTRLPNDFLEFHKVFGDGYLYSRSHKRTANLSVYGGIRSFNFGNMVPKRLQELRLAKERRPKSVPHPLYWEPRGLLPWGRTTNDTDLCWSVRGDLVDNWHVVVLRVAAAASESYECGMAEFLTGLVAGKIRSDLMPSGFPGDKGIAFEAWPFPG
jgi:hypothetical protein